MVSGSLTQARYCRYRAHFDRFAHVDDLHQMRGLLSVGFGLAGRRRPIGALCALPQGMVRARPRRVLRDRERHRVAVTAYVAGASAAEAELRPPGSGADRTGKPSSLPELELDLDAERTQAEGLTEAPRAEVAPAPVMASREGMALPGSSSEPIAA
jgi:hypothetical protein